MALLRGFQKTNGSDTTNKMLELLEKSYLAKTEGGEYNTMEDVQGAIDLLKKLPQGNVDVQTKLAELEGKKLQFGVKSNDVLSQKDMYETQLQAGLDNAAKNNFKNMKSLIGSYAAIYADADERYDAEIMNKILKRYGTVGEIPKEVLDFRQTLEEKAKFYAQLFNSYNVQDPTTGEVGMLNPEGVAVQIDTNPTNGAVQRIDIIPSGQIDDNNYMRTEFGLNVINDLPNKKLPVYLRVNDVGVSEDGKKIRGSMLGNVTYQEKMNEGDSGAMISGGLLSPIKEKTGFFSKLNFLSDTPGEKLNKSIESMKENGVNFSSDAYQYDGQAVPNDTVLQMGSRMFYSTDKEGQILEITGKNSSEKLDNLKKYMIGIGKDPNKVLPYRITKDYLTAPDGSPRIQGTVDADYFNAPITPGQPVSLGTNQPSVFQSPLSETATPTSFFNNKNVLTPPKEPVVGESTPDIIDQGRGYFRNQSTPAFFTKK